VAALLHLRVVGHGIDSAGRLLGLLGRDSCAYSISTRCVISSASLRLVRVNFLSIF